MQYEVWVASADGGTRIDLVPQSDNADAVAELAGALVRVCSGPLQIGVTISGAAAAPPTQSAPAATHRRPGQPAPK